MGRVVALIAASVPAHVEVDDLMGVGECRPPRLEQRVIEARTAMKEQKRGSLDHARAVGHQLRSLNIEVQAYSVSDVNAHATTATVDAGSLCAEAHGFNLLALPGLGSCGGDVVVSARVRALRVHDDELCS